MIIKIYYFGSYVSCIIAYEFNQCECKCYKHTNLIYLINFVRYYHISDIKLIIS